MIDDVVLPAAQVLVYQALGDMVGGHALKHLFGAGATACVLVMLYRRRS